ncbi:hypothetical protein BGZ73_003329 [Actinomortierella ambigua]|nr:hypothetical protein BGZ73_003329 [Actinomortierella ambigua]
MPGAGVALTYLNCTEDQSSALKISLAIGFFLSVFLSFLKHVPIDGSGPPRADPVVVHPSPLAENENAEEIEQDDVAGRSGADTRAAAPITAAGGGGAGVAGGGIGADEGGTPDGLRVRSTRLRAGLDEKGDCLQHKQRQPQQQQYYYVRAQTNQRPKYRRGIIYVEGNSYYLDFGDFHVWGHASLSLVAFGTLALCSASVSQCLFPQVKPWIFVFLQIILLVVCCFIAMFWINDPTLSLGLAIIQDPNAGQPPTPPPKPAPAPAPAPSAGPRYSDGRYDRSYPWQTRPPPTSAAAVAAAAAAFTSSPPTLSIPITTSSTDSLNAPSRVAKAAVSAKATVIPSPMSSTMLASPVSDSSGGRSIDALPRSSSLMSEVTATSGHSALARQMYPPYDAAEIVAARRVVINMDASGTGAMTQSTSGGGGETQRHQEQ